MFWNLPRGLCSSSVVILSCYYGNKRERRTVDLGIRSSDMARVYMSMDVVHAKPSPGPPSIAVPIQIGRSHAGSASHIISPHGPSPSRLSISYHTIILFRLVRS